MGLCKCPKRRVTNQFCFEHRVNVCEYCMVTNHPKCIVQSYLLWLQDSDYNSICELCTKELANEDCIRLICYHVYHWTCINQYAHELPPTTAPAGYMCPSCKVGIFPGENLISPVADILREKLAGVNWARAGLGLPLLIEDEDTSVPSSSNVINEENEEMSHSPKFTSQLSNMELVSKFEQSHPGSSTATNQLGPSPHSVIHLDDTFACSDGFPVSGQVPRRIFEALDESRGTLIDHDENKYERRTAFEWYTRWWTSLGLHTTFGRTSANQHSRNYKMAALLFSLGVITLLFFLSWLGGIVTDDDPNLDPLQNPNIHVERK